MDWFLLFIGVVCFTAVLQVFYLFIRHFFSLLR